jgi:hypothetical protein
MMPRSYACPIEMPKNPRMSSGDGSPAAHTARRAARTRKTIRCPQRPSDQPPALRLTRLVHPPVACKSSRSTR